MKEENSKHYKALQMLDEMIKNLIRSDVEEAKKIIKDEGLDPEQEVSEGLKFIKKMHFKAQASLNQQKDRKLYDQALTKLKSIIIEASNKSGQSLKQFLISKSPSFQFRNIEILNDEELKEIIKDIDVIKLMEELEKEKK